MQSNIVDATKSQRRLRAIVEVVDGELVVFPLANSDRERAEILDALRFLRNEKCGDAL